MSSTEPQTSAAPSEDSQYNNPETCNSKTERKFKDLKPKLLYNGILVGALLAYGIVGGFVFKTFETASVGFVGKLTETLPSSRDLLQELLSEVKSSPESANDENWQNLAVEKLEGLIRRKIDAEQVQEPVQWSFADSWLFACTIFTTIGYGNIAPLSIKGRIFCMLFAVVGIPLFSVVAGSLASFITDLIRTCHAEYHRRKQRSLAAQRKKDDSSSPDVKDEIPNLEIKPKHVAIACLGYLCLGALFFSLGEGWSLFESFYYCFITLSTVGLGDFVPCHVHHTSIFGMYILVGLVLVIMLFGAIEDVINRHCQKLKNKLKVVE
ncbi:hypothetical protein QZH41_010900 [Actinostola sp. cb2023]|nr:hypothetical protein QZH41_010900 [Actinostola sp. cb2023]